VIGDFAPKIETGKQYEIVIKLNIVYMRKILRTHTRIYTKIRNMQFFAQLIKDFQRWFMIGRDCSFGGTIQRICVVWAFFGLF
jgi:hypothetical protein